MRESFLVLTFLGLITVFQSPASAEDSSCLHRTLPLNVKYSGGLMVEGLRAEDLQTKSRAGVKILSIAPDDRPHRIVILLDASESQRARWRDALASAASLAETRLPNTEMALLVFNDQIRDQVDFSQAQSAITAHLRELRSNTAVSRQLVSGKTALYDALLVGLKLLHTPTSADSFYVVSDGGDTASRVHLDQIAQQLAFSGVRVFVGLAESTNSRSLTPEEADGVTSISNLARKTGGEVATLEPVDPANAKEVERVSSAMHVFFQGMAQNYRAELELPVRLDKPSRWELKLSRLGKERWKNAKVNYPTELEACKP